MENIKERIAFVREEIEKAKKRSGREDDVTLIAVTKTYGVDVIQKAWDEGCTTFGENRVQEMMEKLCALAKEWGCDSVYLYVDAENESAYHYYLKCGFRVRNMGMGLKL